MEIGINPLTQELSKLSLNTHYSRIFQIRQTVHKEHIMEYNWHPEMLTHNSWRLESISRVRINRKLTSLPLGQTFISLME